MVLRFFSRLPNLLSKSQVLVWIHRLRIVLSLTVCTVIITFFYCYIASLSRFEIIAIFVSLSCNFTFRHQITRATSLRWTSRLRPGAKSRAVTLATPQSLHLRRRVPKHVLLLPAVPSLAAFIPDLLGFNRSALASSASASRCTHATHSGATSSPFLPVCVSLFALGTHFRRRAQRAVWKPASLSCCHAITQ